jgi:methionyl-tRNA formyltransferase
MELTVFCFPESPSEPPFFQDIQVEARRRNAKFIEARSLGHSRLADFWQTTEFDLLLAVSWRYLIPKSVYSRARVGAFVFHDSILPRYRGFSPTVWAVVNGESETGVTLFEMVEEVDAGDIVDQRVVPIGSEDTIATVMENVTETYLALIERNLRKLSDGTAPRTPQNEADGTFTCRLLPEDMKIDWEAPTSGIYNRIRGYTAPYPGAHCTLEGRVLRIWSAQRVETPRSYVARVPGRVVEVRKGSGSVVLTGDGELLLSRVQIEGEGPESGDVVLKSTSLTLR